MRKVMQKRVWSWFPRSCNEDGIFALSTLDSMTPKTYPWEIFSKNSDGKAKFRRGGWYPLGHFQLANYLGCLRVTKWVVTTYCHYGTVMITKPQPYEAEAKAEAVTHEDEAITYEAMAKTHEAEAWFFGFSASSPRPNSRPSAWGGRSLKNRKISKN